jgi:intracellular septation protein
MKFLFDFFPLILFFAVFKWGGGHQEAAHGLVTHYLSGFASGGVIAAAQAPVVLATVVGIIATVLQIGYLLVRRRAVDTMLWVSLWVILIMGGLTIYFHDDNFIKWKPTILYWAFALLLLVSHLVFNKNLIRKGLEANMKLPEALWARLVYAWVWFLFALGLLNLFVAFVVFKDNLSAWVNFKVFGATGIFFAFVVGQTLLLSKYITEEDA